MLNVVLITALGDEWRLSGTGTDSSVLSPYGALVELRANVSRSDLPVPGGAGVLPGARRFGPISTELEFFLKTRDGEALEETHRRLRQGWAAATRSNPCVISIESDSPLSPLTFELVVDGVLPGVPVDMRRRSAETLTVPVVCFDGVAKSSVMTGTGNVTVTNYGDVPVWPKIRYKGAGGVVTNPSGAKFTLPRAAEETTIDLDPSVLRLEGAFPEHVPPGATGVWMLPAGAQLEWVLGVADPWS
ncbi:hypothetical protein HMPREF2978_08610 [Corynebacterium sp. HMSC074C01]|uniref:hypothetical protein n=1 Tax=Corynebacterium sp. HMSC074C01 TaxID=1739482 RepID=UPI0008A300FC|nr:hypothetical protein [Corynebacterium sp. HMSC074C01]OFP64928.1 hypothetical protein HMPREF2978_08610 [Corynebacterium sp. HMSC074C01]